ncbi:MAG: hypothetical protein AB7V11_03370 [Pyrinomonadaceae bacterium]
METKKRIVNYAVVFLTCAYFSGYVAYRQNQQQSPHCDVEVAFQGSFLYAIYDPLRSTDSQITGLCFSDGRGHGC